MNITFEHHSQEVLEALEAACNRSLKKCGLAAGQCRGFIKIEKETGIEQAVSERRLTSNQLFQITEKLTKILSTKS